MIATEVITRLGSGAGLDLINLVCFEAIVAEYYDECLAVLLRQ